MNTKAVMGVRDLQRELFLQLSLLYGTIFFITRTNVQFLAKLYILDLNDEMVSKHFWQ